MFNLNIKSGGKKIEYKPFSVSLKYVINEKKLAQSLSSIEHVINIQLTDLQRKNILSKEGKEIRVSKHDGKPDEVVFSKVNIDNSFTTDYFRNHLAGFICSIQNESVKSLHIFIPRYDPFEKHFEDIKYYYRTFIEGLFLGNYNFNKYRFEKKQPKDLEVYLYADNEKQLSSAIKTTRNLMDGVTFTRDLQNEPANELYPDAFARLMQKELTPLGIKIKIFDETEIKKRKMGGLLAVGAASAHAPRFVVMSYNGAGKDKKSNTVAIVGKGVTFDSGGISIKPSQDMWEMKGDMSGAAAVAGVMLSAARENIPVNIIGILPLAENMLSGSAMRPGDIVVTASGKSIEIDNTDAEGRVILADALDFASKQEPSVIIDLATLTGACVVALGEFTAGLFSKDAELNNTFFTLGKKTFERTWSLPMWDDFNQYNKSEVADVKNNGGRWGGAVSAAKFLENFVDKKIPWIHIDIAGPAMPNNSSNYSKKYMTGFGVRLLFEYLLQFKS